MGFFGFFLGFLGFFGGFIGFYWVFLGFIGFFKFGVCDMTFCCILLSELPLTTSPFRPIFKVQEV